MTRFFYNPQANVCGLFLYRGNGGNRNNFLTNAECERTCMPRSGNAGNDRDPFNGEEGIEV